MLLIDKLSPVPIYAQVIKELENNIIHGVLKEDEQIPSVRSLSKELTINPNTIQKAYNDLESRGITYTVPGIGRFVSKDAVKLLNQKQEIYYKALYEAVTNLRLHGAKLEEITLKVQDYFKEAPEDDKSN